MRCTGAAVDNQLLNVVDTVVKIQTNTEKRGATGCGKWKKPVREGMLTSPSHLGIGRITINFHHTGKARLIFLILPNPGDVTCG